jgi:hypothetical protein
VHRHEPGHEPETIDSKGTLIKALARPYRTTDAPLLESLMANDTASAAEYCFWLRHADDSLELAWGGR